jgi:hypothetical protein
LAQTITVTATSVADTTKTASVTLTVPAQLAITTTATQLAGQVGTVYSVQLSTSTGISPYKWSLDSTSAALPTGWTLSQGGLLTGPAPVASQAGTIDLVFDVTDSGTPTAMTATESLNLVINPATPISFTGTMPATATYNVVYNGSAMATGGAGALSYSASGLPSWLGLNTTNGAITGKPAAVGPFPFTVTAKDAYGDTANQGYTITVSYPALVVTPATLPTGYVGANYTQTMLAATGGSGAGYSFALASGSSLPAGLNLSAGGLISGKPTGTPGTTNFTVTATDSASDTGNGSFSITVDAELVVTLATLPTGYDGSQYTQTTLAATGGSGMGYTWTLANGTNLPTGLGLSSGGVISGKPTGTPGTTNFTAAVTDSVGNTASGGFSITVNAGISFSPVALPIGYQGAAYPPTTLLATGGSGTGYTWSWVAASGTTLPAGLGLSTGGVISGTPTGSGTFNLVITVTDSVGNTASTSPSLNVEAALAITTATPLTSGSVGQVYSTALAATGGTGTYTWTVPAASDVTCLGQRGLSLSTMGVLSSGGKLLTSGEEGTCTNFGVLVSDNATPAHTASSTFTVSVSAISLSPSSLPFAITGLYFAQTLTASGGNAPYTFAVTANSAGLAAIGLGLTSSSSTTASLSGTVPSSAATSPVTFSVLVTDSTGATATVQYTLNVYAPLTLTAPSSTVPGPAIISTAYTGSTIYASGGSGNYSWSLNNSLPPGWSYSNPTGNSLVISGTAPSTSESIGIFVTLTDTTTSKTYGPIGYSISVGPPTPLTLQAGGSLPSVMVNSLYTGGINASGGSGSGYIFSINSVPVPTDGSLVPISDSISVSNTGGSTLSISGIPTQAGSVTITNVSVTDSAGDNAGPDTYTITVNPLVPTGQTVSGTLTYAGSQTGWVYLALTPNNNNGNNQIMGTAIDARTANALKNGVSYTIKGVPSGQNYTLSAWMDNIGYGAPNAANPSFTGTTNGVVVSSSAVTANVTLVDPSPVNLGTLTPGFDSNNGLGAFNGGAVIGFDPITNNGIELPASYEVQWSTSSSFSSVAGSKCFPATGANETNPYVIAGLTNSNTQPYYFRAAGNLGACGSSTTGLTYSTAVPSGGLLIGPPSTGSLLSGTVTFTLPTGVSASGKTLYAGCYDANTSYIYADPITSPVSPQAYSVDVPNGTNCEVFGFIDLNNIGLIGGPGEIANTNNGVGMIAVTVNGAMPNEDITLPSGNNLNSAVEVKTQTNSGGANYGIGFQVFGEYKLPVAVELATETPDVTGTVADVVLPSDIASGAFNGNKDTFDFWPQVTGAPVAGDSYNFNVTYSDGTTETLPGAVTGVLSAFATNLSPTGTGVSLTPNFSWTYPANNASSYLYQFQLQGNNSETVWEIPQKHSNSNGFPSTTTPFITWGVDPTNTGDLPDSNDLSNGGLSALTSYNWSIETYDTYGNEAQTQVSFTTGTAALSLPASGSGGALFNALYEQSINASGGLGSYAFTVNGTSIPSTGIGSAVIFTGGDELEAYSSGSQLTVFGKPIDEPETIKLVVSVTDGTNTTSQTYTINVATLPTPGSSNAYNANLNGTYVCKSNGYDDASGARWASVYTLLADGQGNFTTGGTYDTNTRDLSAAISGGYTGTYNIGADNNGITNMTATIDGSSTTVTSSWAIALTSSATPATEFRTVRIDDVGVTPSGIHGTGHCYLANTSAFAASTLSGKSFAYGMQGEDGSGNPLGNVGRYTAGTESATGGTGGVAGGSISSGYLDVFVSGSSSELADSFAGSYTLPNATTGRFTASLLTGSSTTPGTYVEYIIDAGRMFILEADPVSTINSVSMQAGDVRTQLQSANTAAVLLDGPSILYGQGYEYTSGIGISGYDSSAYQVSGTGNGTLTVNASYDDDDSTYKVGKENAQSVSVTFPASPNAPGRATFSPGGDTSLFYFFGAGSAFYLDFNGSESYLATGWLESQTQTTFTDTALAGNYLLGKLPPLTAANNDTVGEFDLANSGNITGGISTAGQGDFSFDQSSPMTYEWDPSATAGTGSLLIGSGSKGLSCVVISTTEFVCLENGSTSADMMVVQQ